MVDSHGENLHELVDFHGENFRELVDFHGENFRELVDSHGENFQGLLAGAAKGCHAPKFRGESCTQGPPSRA